MQSIDMKASDIVFDAAELKRAQQFFLEKQKETGIQLNEVQQTAVMQTNGPLLLLASPGSGKTTVLVMRIGYLIEVKRANSFKIAALTFSKAAATDMKDRYRRFFPYLPDVTFSTIHSFAFEIARRYMQQCGIAYQIIEGRDEDTGEGKQQGQQGHAGRHGIHKKLILRQIYEQHTNEHITDDQMEELLRYISYVKNKMLTVEERSRASVHLKDADLIFEKYEHIKKNQAGSRWIDFDDMLEIAYEALQSDHELRQFYAARYDYLLTDESQDTSLVQHKMIEALASVHKNLCVVADDDQSIYSWRGAEPNYLLSFKKVYPQAVTLYMEQNYRSAPLIVAAADAFIKQIDNRYPKQMHTANKGKGGLRFVHTATHLRQADYIIEQLKSFSTEELSDTAVLYRNNQSSVFLMNAFDAAGIPFYMKDADNRFFSHWVIADILNFMRLSYTEKRLELLESVYTKMNGYITGAQMKSLKQAWKQEQELRAVANTDGQGQAAEGEEEYQLSVFDTLLNKVPLQNYQYSLLTESRDMIRQMNGMPPQHAIRVVRERLGYNKALERLSDKFGFRLDYLFYILETIEEIAAPLQTMEQFAARLKQLEQGLKQAKGKREDAAVTLSTFHSAKGLEFRHVFMIDVMEGVIPAKEEGKQAKSSDNANEANDASEAMDEAIRLFYVGLTRAKETVELLTYEERGGVTAKESRFVTKLKEIVRQKHPAGSVEQQIAAGLSVQRDRSSEVRVTDGIAKKTERARPQQNPNAISSRSQLRVGLRIKHAKFGIGTIQEISDNSLNAQFGQKETVLSISICLEMRLLEACE